ncbi:hypothetical protein ABMA28_005215 [Loxostege sticticalis]|uniref:Chitin-binding type-2 domain-containing protein n=1 Tax=Loxostege sticticalis TaxID=481309 RepID=A0ABD0SPP0_LOXSC
MFILLKCTQCGAHGRFEYCINGIPGCVVGCHCHPGYYFDTDTKICEPNVKLTQDYRRHYNLEPTRLPVLTPPTNSPTPTTANPIDDKVDAIAKDADDLGDWLYNQFFKTIENQVINSTDDEKITRRSGTEVAKPTPKILRRSHKRSNKKSKKKKSMKNGLRRKLLRITEDDSLFDSSSGSASSESSSSSDSDTSFETDKNKDNKEKGHGHRKIVMFNKRPTPPLPSFIFLPNVETPFYPPIGLPPPPIVPMYPMVPVPPVGPYFPEHCSDNETTSTPTSKATTTNADASTTVTTQPRPDNNYPDKPSQPDNNYPDKPQQPDNENPEYPENPADFAPITPIISITLSFQLKPISSEDGLNNPPPPTSFNPMLFRSNDENNPSSPMEDVDFKYLSQLIHKIDLNKTKPGIPPFNPRQRMVDLPNTPFRRNYQNTPPTVNYYSTQKSRPASKADDMNDTFYTNLGRQIASLIRKVDSDGDRQIHIEIEQHDVDPMQTVFNENRYAPRSYWERFVRSPLRRGQSYGGETNHLKGSNENLFNLEDQVSVAAANGRSLSLHELENIANIMEITKARSRQKIKKNVYPSTSSRSYNINLLPQIHRRVNAVTQVSGTNDKPSKKPVDRVNPNMRILSTRHQNIYPTHNTQTAKISNTHINDTHKNRTMPSEVKKKMDFINNFMKSRLSTLHHQVPRIVPQYKNITNPEKVAAQQLSSYQANPLPLNYNNMKYVSHHHNPYQGQRILSPFQMPFFSETAAQSTGRERPSYFHHEFHHFDYFE